MQEACREAINDEYCALFEEHKHHGFVDALLASQEYEAFYGMMCRGKGEQATKEAEEKGYKQ
jgi:hypothetical protein